VLPSTAVIDAVVSVVVNEPFVTTRIRPLLLYPSAAVGPGEWVDVVAGDMGTTKVHDAIFILQGPGSKYERLVHIQFGIAAGMVYIPAHLAPGLWALGAEDPSEVTVIRPNHFGGVVLFDLAVFTVGR
jgi:hypothetical protein